ncbi:MAG TPA: hypothetical protein VGE78_06610 [Agromyces sp.]
MSSPIAEPGAVRFRGLTWDHPRGRAALERSAVASAGLIAWDVHPLEGFESSPIDELAERYDVIVLDHPHLGDALATQSLRPLGELFDADWLASLDAASVGPSLASYRLDGELWALPLDAATQVAVMLPERVRSAPRTWAEVLELSYREPVALSLAGPHALLGFASLCVALGEEPRDEPGAGFVSASTAEAAIALLRELAGRAPDGTDELNPIGLLERMRRERDIAYVPLVYGYVNYAAGEGGLQFADAPAVTTGGRRGSTIGGTGLAVSRRAAVDDELVAHLRWHLDPLTQSTFIPEHDGQPSSRRAWRDDHLNAASRSFYRSTLATIDDAWVRPRVAGFTAFQAAASALVRSAVVDRDAAAEAVRELNHRYDALAREGVRR